MYQKHDYSVFHCLFGIFGEERSQRTLRALAGRSPFTVLDIGCGFGLRYTGHVLYGLARNAITDVDAHIADPALYGHGTHLAIGEIQKCFPKAAFHLYSDRWDPRLVTIKPDHLQLAVAIQATSLFDDAQVVNLHRDLHMLLGDGGIFIDISEENDFVSDRDAYPYLQLYSRNKARRIAIARDCGFELLHDIACPAHAAGTPDDQVMLGLAFRKSR